MHEQPRPPASATDADCTVVAHFTLPQERLQPYVTFFYSIEAFGPLSDFLYPEWGAVRFVLCGNWHLSNPGFDDGKRQLASLYGPTDRHGRILADGGKTVGFSLSALGWHRLIGKAAGRMANRVVPLGDRLGVDGMALWAQLQADRAATDSFARFDRLLLGLLDRRPPVGAHVLAADLALRTRPATLAAFAGAAHVSERTLHRICLDAFGFPPKRLMRRQRFLDTMGRIRTGVDEALGEALDPAYFDQSHFYRDFRDFLGMTPRAYFRAPRPLMTAASEAQIRAGVTLSFKLPPPPEA